MITVASSNPGHSLFLDRLMLQRPSDMSASDMNEPTPSETQAQIFKAVREKWTNSAGLDENRGSGRTPCSAPAHVTPADENGQPTGEPLAAQLRDLSDNGVGLLMDESPQSAYLQLEVPYNVHETLSVTVWVVYCHPSDKGYRVGCQIMWPTPDRPL